MKTAALILAAGEASRYGSPKQLLEIDEQTLIQRAAHLACDAHCSPIIIVTGAYHQQISQLAFPENVTLVENTQWVDGMGRSVAKGAKAIQLIQNQSSEPTEAVLILLADQPAINLGTITKLKNEFDDSIPSIVISKHQDVTGPPSLFHSKYIPELVKLKGDLGAKSIVKNNTQWLAFIDAPEASWDIDTIQVWSHFMNLHDDNKIHSGFSDEV